MLSTAQNRCGVFVAIGTILTGRKKTAIVCSRLYEEINNCAFPAARACM
jgi:hypothetical protein